MGTGKTYSTKYLLDSNNSSGVAGQVLSTTSTGIDWVDANTVPGSGLWLANGNNIYNSNSGNVGIGTTSPDSPLEIQFVEANGTSKEMLHLDYNPTDNYGSAIFKISSGASANDIFEIEQVTGGGNGDFGTYLDTNIINRNVSSGAYGNINFVTGSSTSASSIVMTIGGGTQKGNVGIGTTSPSSFNSRGRNLVVNSNGDTGITISANTTSSSTLLFADAFAGTGGTAAYRGAIEYDHANDSMALSTSAIERMRITSAGNVGINCTPSYKLQWSDGTRTGLLDTNIGAVVIGSVSNDALALYTNLTEKMRITSAGNVGIGTTNPVAPLHIVTPAVAGVDLTDISRTANNLVRFTNPQYSTSATMGLLLRVFPDSDARQGAGLLMTGGSDNAASNLSLFVSKDDGSGNNISKSYSALHIAGNTGNVGIGTTSPDSKLDVKGTSATPADGNQTLSITNSTGGTQLNLGTAENSYGWIEAREGSTLRNLLINPNGGKVGIGTTSPTAAKLVVDSSVAPQLLVKNSSGGNAQILFEDNSGGTQNASITFDQASQNTLTIATGYQSPTDLNRINIAPAGNIGLTVRGGTGGSGLGQPLVGIGTTTPSEKLEVNGNIKVIESGQTPDVSVFHTDGSYAKLRGQGLFLSRATSYVAPVADNFGSLAVGYNGARWGNVEINAATVKFENGSNEFMRITSAGNVGIGTTSPGSKLQVAGEIRVADGNKGAPSYSFTSDTNTGMYSDAADAIKFTVGGTDTLAMNSSNNVGIGTSAPDVKFHVTTSEDGSGIDKGTAKFINTNTGQGATTMHMVQTSSSAYANAVKFWQGSTPTAVGFIRLTTSATQFITSASDLNLKKNITTWSDDTLSKFKALEPKKFRFKTQDTSEDKTLGFIAQNEVDNFPEAYPQFLGEDEKPYYGFNPTGMVPHLMKAIKDLVEKVETLENKITQLENNN